MPETDKLSAPEEGQPDNRHLSFWLIGGICAILLAVHAALRVEYGTMKDGLDAIALGLIVVGLSPFIATVLKSLKFGGFEVSFQEVKERIDRQEREIDELYALAMGQKVFTQLEKLLGSGGYGKFYLGSGLQRELSYLENLGFIEFKGELQGKAILGLDDLLSGFGTQNEIDRNLSEFISITVPGMRFHQLRLTALARIGQRARQKEGASA